MRLRKNARLHIWLFLMFTIGASLLFMGREAKTATVAPSKVKLTKATHTSKMRQKILLTVKKSLPQKHQAKVHIVTSTIMSQSAKYKLDPFIVTAVISGESSFNPDAIGSVGEIGLMQLRPSTAKWICKKMNLPWKGVKSLKNPVTNIQIGTAYLSYLHDKLGHEEGYMYLAAYNMGVTNVMRALSKKVKPKFYSEHVMNRYITLDDSLTSI